jgi:hypothetical protein
MILKEIKPLVSIVIFIFSLFTLVFLQMEERRLNYELLKLNKELKKTLEARRFQEIKLAKATRPERIEREIQFKTAFTDPRESQIIHMNSGIAFEGETRKALPKNRLTIF